MKYLFYILIVTSLIFYSFRERHHVDIYYTSTGIKAERHSFGERVLYTNYTWNVTNGNITISDAAFGTNLNSGDTVFIPVKTGGYRSYSIQNCLSGTRDGINYVNVYWMPGAYRAPSSSNNFADFINNSTWVKTIGMEAQDHVDQWRLGTTGYSSFIWFDSCNFRGSNGFGPIYTGSLASFDGTLAKSMHDWTFTYCVWDTLYNNGSGGVGLNIGALQRYGFWFNTTVQHCSFDNYSSGTLPSNFIQVFNSFGTLIDQNTFARLGNNTVSHPVGHASAINWYGSQGTVSNNVFGEDIFGNDVRGKFADCTAPGTSYLGTSFIFNNISMTKRKYPVIEVQQTDTTGWGSGYVRRRSAPQVWNITAYNVAVGAGGNDPYQTTIVDCYLTDSVHVKNSVITVIRDTTWGTALGPSIFTQSTGAITFKDTAGCRLVQLWVNSGINDSTFFYPTLNGILFNTGVTVPAYITRDVWGNSRTSGAGVDIGAAELVTTPPIGTGRKGIWF
jgi:hypothetical protein